MKILHTSDLHIGKKLMGRERYGEYEAMLDGLASICREEGVELVLVAGDVFDTFTPSAEAEKIFYSGIKKIAALSTVLIISGNHDDYVRLTAAAALAEEMGIYIIGNDLQPIKPRRHAGAFPVQSESGYVVFSNAAGEKIYINTLPYPNEARFKEGRTDETFTEKITRWIEFGERGNTQNLPSIFLSHIFVAGGKTSDSEREIDLGGARAVPCGILPQNSYCALGHLHRNQKIGDNVYYSGAPMQFTFDEAGSEKYVNIFELSEGGVKNFKLRKLAGVKQLVRLEANGVQDGIKLLAANPEAYVELTLHLTEPLSSADNSALHGFDNLVSLKAAIPMDERKEEKRSNKNKSSSELFTEYYFSKFGCEPSGELLGLFLSLTEEE